MKHKQTGKKQKGPYRVKELADIADVTVDAVRYYTKERLLTPTRQKSNNYKIYDQRDLLRLLFIQRAKTLGYTVSEIKKIFSASERGESPCPLVRDLLAKRVTQNKKLLEESLALQKRIENATRQWRSMPDAVPIGNSICHLIESVT